MTVPATTDQHYLNPRLTITNARGEPAQVDGVPVWAASDPTVMAIKNLAPDGMSAESIEFVGAGTGARVTITCDADLGVGVQTLTLTTEDHDVTIGPKSVASNMVMDLGQLTDK